MDNIILIAGIAFAILQIILFFKIWGMCDNIADIRQRLKLTFPNEQEKIETANKAKYQTQDAEDKNTTATSIDGFKIGDKVIYEPANRKMIIKEISKDGKLVCVSYKPNGKEEYEGAYLPTQVKSLE